jgi:hypothetical protein
MEFSDYIVYVDESGDHGLTSINPQHPVFVLAFCVVHKPTYVNSIVPALQSLKFEFWGHDSVVLHGHEIRKAQGDFNILLNATIRARFFERINEAIEAADFTIIAAVIDKQRHVGKYSEPADPYEIALGFCMERLQLHLIGLGQAERMTHIQVECRGKVEDAKLELEFRRICDGQNAVGPMPNLDIRFMDKKHNSTGLQLADLVAHPIGRHIIAPDQPNRAYAILERKFRRGSAGQVKGLRSENIPLKSERPRYSPRPSADRAFPIHLTSRWVPSRFCQGEEKTSRSSIVTMRVAAARTHRPAQTSMSRRRMPAT